MKICEEMAKHGLSEDEIGFITVPPEERAAAAYRRVPRPPDRPG